MFTSNWSHNVAICPNRNAAQDGGAREGFRPVALPALAAAVHATAKVTRNASDTIAAGLARRFTHEDDPSE